MTNCPFLYYNQGAMKLLIKLFVKNHNDVKNPTVREKVGTLSGFVCIVLNVILGVAKILVGSLFGIISVVADGTNNLTDCGGNIVSVVSIKMANKPADKQHPYGHARIEYIASMIVSFLVLMLGYELGSEAVGKIISTVGKNISLESDELSSNVWWIVGALALSILVKFYMFAFNRRLGKTYSSDLMLATSTDSISDCVSTFAVLVATLVNYFTNNALPWLDGVMGVLVALLIAFAGLKLFKETMSVLVGEAPTGELVDEIVDRIKKYPEVLGIHDLNVHSYGEGKFYASVHVEVDSTVPVLESHDVIDQIERDFAENTNVTMVIHLDPVVVGDAELEFYKSQIAKTLGELDGSYSFHDVRMVKGYTHTNVIFDVAIPFDAPHTEGQIKETLSNLAKSFETTVFFVVTVERQMCKQ